MGLRASWFCLFKNYKITQLGTNIKQEINIILVLTVTATIASRKYSFFKQQF